MTKQLKFRDQDHRTVELCTEIIESVAEGHDLSLRAIERIFSILAIALAVTDERLLRVPPVLAGLCILKVLEPDLYRKAKKGSLTLADVDKIFFSQEGNDDAEKRRLQWSREWWQFCIDPAMPKERINEMASNSSLFRHSLRREQIVPFTANRIIDRYAPRIG